MRFMSFSNGAVTTKKLRDIIRLEIRNNTDYKFLPILPSAYLETVKLHSFLGATGEVAMLRVNMSLIS